MILGVCIDTLPEPVKMAKEIGYRYVEVGLRGVHGEKEERLEPFLRALDENKIRCEAANCPFPGEYNPDGKQTSDQLEAARDKMYDLIKKTSPLCIERLIIGAGGARVLPSPDKYENVMSQMADICKYAISPVLSEFGIIAVLEGLNKKETTILLTTAQSVELAKLTDLPNIKVMADLYHVHLENENLGDFPDYRGYIHHSHIALPVPRVMPSPDDGFDYKPFFAALRSAGFNGRMSVEAGAKGEYRESLVNAFRTIAPLC